MRHESRMRGIVAIGSCVWAVSQCISFAATEPPWPAEPTTQPIIAPAARTAFLPEAVKVKDFAPEYRDVVALGRRSDAVMAKDDPDTQTLMRSMPTVAIRGMRIFLKDEYIPPMSYVQENLVLARGVSGAGMLRRDLPTTAVTDADVAYLSYRVDGRDFLVAQSFGLGGRVQISIGLTTSEQRMMDRVADLPALVGSLCTKYMREDRRAPFEIVVRRSVKSDKLNAHLLWSNPAGKASNYRRFMRGTYTASGLCLVFTRYPFYETTPGHASYEPPQPKWRPDGDRYFDRMLSYREPTPEDLRRPLSGKSSDE